MQLKYRLYRRSNGGFCWLENGTAEQGSLKTKDKREGANLLHAMHEAHRQPTLTLAAGRAYLPAHDPRMIERTNTPRNTTVDGTFSLAYGINWLKSILRNSTAPIGKWEPTLAFLLNANATL